MCCTLLLKFNAAKAQSFAVAHDTVTIAATSASGMFIDSIINLTSSVVNVQWKVIATNFPGDWLTPCTGFCDPFNCYTATSLWPSGTTNSFGFGPGGDMFDMVIDFDCAVSTGCYYLTVRVNNTAIPSDTALATFIVCKPAATGIAHAGKTNCIAITQTLPVMN